MTTPPQLPPPAALLQMINGFWIPRCVYVVAKLGVADQLKTGPRPVAEVARALELSVDGLYRVMRALASVGIFTEVPPRTFGLTPLGQLLVSDAPGSLRPHALMVGTLGWGPWGQLEHSVRTGKPAFDHVNGEAFFPYMEHHPDQGKLLDNAMAAMAVQRTQALLGAYDFSGFRKIVDVGAGAARMLTGILQANPQASGVAFDSPRVAPTARQRIAELGLADRCQVVGGDFFQEVPSGGDLYLMAWILHDWEDGDAIRILKSCRRAVAAHGKVVVVETVVPPGDAPGFAKLLDVNMLVQTGGRERTQDEYATLFQAAGFKLSRVIPTSGPFSLLEATGA
jgi:hypothetical protein